MATDGLVLYLGVYDGAARAEQDFEELAELHRSGRVGTYDAALVEKDERGAVRLHKHEQPTRNAAWTGIGAGAVLGLLFPPSIIGSAIVGGLAGGLGEAEERFLEIAGRPPFARNPGVMLDVFTSSITENCGGTDDVDGPGGGPAGG